MSSKKATYCKYLRKIAWNLCFGRRTGTTAANFTFSYLESNQRIKKEGYQIISVTNKGYCLSDETDVISAEGIGPYLTNGSQDMIHVFKTVDSTNLVAKNGVGAGASRYCSVG